MLQETLTGHPAPDDRLFMGGMPLDFLLGEGLRHIAGPVAQQLLLTLWGEAQDQKKARKTGRVYLSDDTVHRRTGARKKSLTRARKHLQELGLIKVLHTGNQYRPTHYQLSTAVWRWSAWCGCGRCTEQEHAPLAVDALPEEGAVVHEPPAVRRAPVQAFPRGEEVKKERGTARHDWSEEARVLSGIKARVRGTKHVRVHPELPQQVQQRVDEGIPVEDLRIFVEVAASHKYWGGFPLVRLLGSRFDDAWEELGPCEDHMKSALDPEKRQDSLAKYRAALEACQQGRADVVIGNRTNRQWVLAWAQYLEKMGVRPDPAVPDWLTHE